MTKQQLLAITQTTSVKPNIRKEGKAWPASQAYPGGAAVGYGRAEHRRKMRILDVPKSSLPLRRFLLFCYLFSLLHAQSFILWFFFAHGI